jgi:hypothetical protein
MTAAAVLASLPDATCPTRPARRDLPADLSTDLPIDLPPDLPTDLPTDRGVVMTRLMLTLSLWARERRPRDERGDVPGWVLSTVMTAGLVAALWAVAGPQLSRMLSDALSSVRG